MRQTPKPANLWKTALGRNYTRAVQRTSYAGVNRIKFAGLKLISAQPLRTPGGLDFTLIGVL
jgi:hypothetical protein